MLVWCAHAPWRDLGGIVDERVRWAERAALVTAIWIGLVVGDRARERPALRLRPALWPPTAAAAVVSAALQLAGRPWWATIVAGAWLGYVAGVDTGAAVARLLDGNPRSDDDVSWPE